MRKLDICGSKKGAFYFEYPKLTSVGNSFMVDGEFNERVVSKLEGCIGVGIYSLKLTFSDGTTSPLIGGRDITHSIDIIDQES